VLLQQHERGNNLKENNVVRKMFFVRIGKEGEFKNSQSLEEIS